MINLEEKHNKEHSHSGKKADAWWNDDLKFTLMFAVFGIAVGYFSFLINRTAANVLLMVAVFAGSVLLSQKIWKVQETKGWWFGKFIVYIFMWFIVWTIFHTLCHIYAVMC